MNIEVVREEFERWLAKEFPRYSLERFPHLAGHMRAGEYQWVDVELMWRAWAARK